MSLVIRPKSAVFLRAGVKHCKMKFLKQCHLQQDLQVKHLETIVLKDT